MIEPLHFAPTKVILAFQYWYDHVRDRRVHPYSSYEEASAEVRYDKEAEKLLIDGLEMSVHYLSQMRYYYEAESKS